MYAECELCRCGSSSQRVESRKGAKAPRIGRSPRAQGGGAGVVKDEPADVLSAAVEAGELEDDVVDAVIEN